MFRHTKIVQLQRYQYFWWRVSIGNLEIYYTLSQFNFIPTGPKGKVSYCPKKIGEIKGIKLHRNVTWILDSPQHYL